MILNSWSCLFVAFLALLSSGPASGQNFLRVEGGRLSFGGQRVFLSGANIAWNYYGTDFGNHQYDSSGPTLEGWLDRMSAAGANAARIWVFVEGEFIPNFNGDGYVLGGDRDGTLADDLRRFLDHALSRDIFVILTLWNGALMRQQNLINLAWDDAKLQSFIDNALTPLVNALRDHPALGAWEIMNEPEGSVLVQGESDFCSDTSPLSGSGAGWAGANVPMHNFQRFINWQASAIKNADGKALVTVGSWSERPQTDQFGFRNYYTDNCLISAGGKSNGVLDFYQMHAYSYNGAWSDSAVFKHPAGEYGVDKPLLIGEFASVCAQGEGIAALMDHAYFNGYSGALTWQYNAGGDCSDSQDTQDQGFSHVVGYNDQGAGGLVNVDI